MDPQWQHAVTQGAFGHGYLLTSGALSSSILVQGWAHRKVEGLHLHTNPRTKVTTSTERSLGTVIFLGDPLDVDHDENDATIIADAILFTLRTSGPEAAVRQAAYLSGRWTLILLHGRKRLSIADQVRSPLCWIVPDTMGSQGSYYNTTPQSFAYASSASLVAMAAGSPTLDNLEGIRDEIKRIRPKGVTYLPGTMTAYEGVQPILPNCLLEIDRRAPDQSRHRRFWPWKPNEPTDDIDEVYGQYKEQFGAYLRLAARDRRVGVSLTGGQDSTGMLAHLFPYLGKDAFAFTYFNPNNTEPGTASDVFLANELAGRLGLQHRVLQWRGPEPESPYNEIHRRMNPTHYVSHGAAHAMWADLPSNFTHINSLGGEIGTTYARARDYREPDPIWFTRFWMSDKFTKYRRYLNSFEHYLDYTDFSVENMADYDQHNVAYWELRVGKWGYTKFLDADQGHRCIPAFNDRRLIEIMLRLPQEHLEGKALYQRTFAERPRFQPVSAPSAGRKVWLTGDDSL
ncbi:hypothetical protein [Ornithinimicrobium sp. INDO-MA30-4]|uniref:hypothetical protein n=1 Tax=Ornithinimicrobium sp. INDO-MA30-4 TaxID=2908651 RepID=UPI001F44A413|nr:hypothetical protein [Ornithinimicrobium sp. INDO-MA30-4]UJH70093.1 hypothetical protein L0A91_12935 [Ornithinimicrobium sp. INDO-MA30-4]